MTDQATRLRQMVGSESAAPPITPAQAEAWTNVRVIAITSGKGGVGKTNLAVNLALALQTRAAGAYP